MMHLLLPAVLLLALGSAAQESISHFRPQSRRVEGAACVSSILIGIDLAEDLLKYLVKREKQIGREKNKRFYYPKLYWKMLNGKSFLVVDFLIVSK